MTNYRETMAQTLEFMHIMNEFRINERELTDTEQKRREEIAQDMNDSDFKDRYGDRWKEVKMAVATKQAKNESVDEEADLKKLDTGQLEKQLGLLKIGKPTPRMKDTAKRIRDELKSRGIKAEEVDLDEAKFKVS